jgi:hypothetical protein
MESAYASYEWIREQLEPVVGEERLGAGLGTAGYLRDASPLVVERLRHHSHHLGGDGPGAYRSPGVGEEVLRHLDALLEVATPDLAAPEPPILGAFGAEVQGGFHNRDTLTVLEALVALEQGGILGHLRSGGERRVVLELGGGFGGFARALRTLCPDVTYVMADAPGRFLLSAPYLMSALPEARVHVHDPAAPEDTRRRMSDHDLVLVPEEHLAGVDLGPVDLTVAVGSLDEVPSERVEMLVERAWALESAFLYALVRTGAGVRPDPLERVRSAVEERYWLQETPILDRRFRRVLDDLDRPKRKLARLPSAPRDGLEHDHLLGWRRILR